ncbi:GGDEF domain-containing protein [Dechloromonas sp. ZY10]|uniref:GGDEF domain-containing protein n=1 Tax=Dechloromonas aquae TaxID=2664436 RepID=UPI0035289BA4
MIEHQAIFLTGSLLMLANGGILWLVHREILPQLQGSARTWRHGTFLFAGACLIFATLEHFPPRFGLLLADAWLLIGASCYWYSLGQFFHRSPGWPIGLPAILGILGVSIFLFAVPSYQWRQIAITLALLAILAGSVGMIPTHRNEQTQSSQVIRGTFALATLLILIRLIRLLLLELPDRQALFPPPQPGSLLTPLIIVLLPCICTTAFLLMCSERLKQRLEKAASTDYLTALPNRRTLAEQGRRAFTEACAAGRGYAVAIIDIDHFKAVNDTYGHETGDEALKHVASLLRRHCRSNELPTRQGGEEFVILLDGISAEHALLAGERLRASVEAHPCRLGERELQLTVSIGMAVRESGDERFDHLLSRADAALYRAKASGRNRVILASHPGAAA